MVDLPIGYRPLPGFVLPRGMGSYVNSLAKDKSTTTKLGSIVNGKMIEIFISNGSFICAVPNSCYIVKSLAVVKPVTVIERNDILKLKPSQPDISTLLEEEKIDGIIVSPEYLHDVVCLQMHTCKDFMLPSGISPLIIMFRNVIYKYFFFDWRRLNWKDRTSIMPALMNFMNVSVFCLMTPLFLYHIIWDK